MLSDHIAAKSVISLLRSAGDLLCSDSMSEEHANFNTPCTSTCEYMLKVCNSVSCKHVGRMIYIGSRT